VKGRFSHFTSELKRIDPKQEFLEFQKDNPQLMKRTYTWWKEEYVQVRKCPHISISSPLHIEATFLHFPSEFYK